MSSVNNVTTRQGEDLYVERSKTDIGSRQITIRGPLLFNKQPRIIKEAGSVSTFKSNFKKLLLSDYHLM